MKLSVAVVLTLNVIGRSWKKMISNLTSSLCLLTVIRLALGVTQTTVIHYSLFTVLTISCHHSVSIHTTHDKTK